MSEHAAWSVPVRIEDIPEEGRQVHLAADEGARAEVARQAGLLGVSRLEADFDLRRAARGSIDVSGRVTATVRQTCVVSLEPMDNIISEPVAITFVPEGAPATSGDADPDAVDIEPLIDGRIDLGAIAGEFLILGVDPYPRKEGAEFVPPPGASERSSPFDVLDALKKR